MKFDVVYYEEIDSTNTEARRKSVSGAKEGFVVIADKQNAGKGRRGRTWESPAGENLYFSLLLRPEIPPEKAPMLTLVMAYSVARVIRSLYGMQAQIKWPNDLLLDGKKVCGILTEMHLQHGRIEDVIVGTGINVNGEQFPQELLDKAASLYQQAKKKLDRKELLEAVLQEFEKKYEIFLECQDLSYLQDAYNQMLINKDREVLVLEPGNEYKAIALGINQEGELLVKKEDGEIEAVFAGEVSVRGIYGYV